MNNATDISTAPLTSTGAELLAKTFAPVRWAVPDILAEGVTLFGGREKMGKSWLALGLCIAVATGGYALGKKPVERGESLYLSLEDNERRLQDRLWVLCDEDTDLSTFHYATRWNRADDGGVGQLDAWLTEHPENRLVVIDTLKRIRPYANGRRNLYEVDYEAIEPFVSLAFEHNTAIVVVHHLNQNPDPADPYDAFSGSAGLTAAVEGILLLTRERGQADAYLTVDGKDIKDRGELALKWESDTCTWTIQGEAEEYKMSKERREIVGVLDDAEKPMRPQEIADVLDKKSGNVRYLLSQMVKEGQVERNGDGTYTTTNTTNDTNSSNSVSGVSAVSRSNKKGLHRTALVEMDEDYPGEFLSAN